MDAKPPGQRPVGRDIFGFAALMPVGWLGPVRLREPLKRQVGQFDNFVYVSARLFARKTVTPGLVLGQ